MVNAQGKRPGFEVEIEVEEEPYNVDRVVSAATSGTESKESIGVESGTLFRIEGRIGGEIAEDVEHGEEGGRVGGLGGGFILLGAYDGRKRGAEGSCRGRIAW